MHPLPKTGPLVAPTRRLGSALGGVSVPHLRVGLGMDLLSLGSALPRWLLRTFALRYPDRILAGPRGRVVPLDKTALWVGYGLLEP